MPKSKRQSRQSRQTRKVSAGASAIISASTGGGSGGSLYEREFKPDYSQTIKDLRRIAVLASSFIGILVILSFFLR
jgi:hypothetical protein